MRLLYCDRPIASSVPPASRETVAGHFASPVHQFKTGYLGRHIDGFFNVRHIIEVTNWDKCFNDQSNVMSDQIFRKFLAETQ